MINGSTDVRVSVAVRNGVADVRLNRPDKINALDDAMFAALSATAEMLANDRSVRVVVLSGEGRGFCAGLDFASFSKLATRERSPDLVSTRSPDRITNRAQHAAWVWTELPMPVIAAVHGVALGGGLQLALGADLRIVSPDSRLSVLEIRWGLIPDMTGSYVLPRLVGLDVAKELTWTGRMVSGEEAVRLGLATRLSETPRKEALELAAKIATNSPHAIRASKALLNRSLLQNPAQQFVDEEKSISLLIGTENQSEAVRAYFEKRQPVYVDPV